MTTVMAELDELHALSLQGLEAADSSEALEEWYRATLGRKGTVQLQTRLVGQLAPEERPVFGRRINEIKQALEAAYEERRE